jgi:hypothetical protein
MVCVPIQDGQIDVPKGDLALMIGFKLIESACSRLKLKIRQMSGVPSSFSYRASLYLLSVGVSTQVPIAQPAILLQSMYGPRSPLIWTPVVIVMLAK